MAHSPEIERRLSKFFDDNEVQKTQAYDFFTNMMQNRASYASLVIHLSHDCHSPLNGGQQISLLRTKRKDAKSKAKATVAFALEESDENYNKVYDRASKDERKTRRA